MSKKAREALTRKELQRRIRILRELLLAEPSKAALEEYLGWSKERFDRVFMKPKPREKARQQEWATSYMEDLIQKDSLYGMVQVMCVMYFTYMVGWKEIWGEASFKPIYGARYALHSRNRSWSVCRLKSFLARVRSFEELLLAVCVEPNEMPDRPEELRNWLKQQKEVSIPHATWSKEEALESNIGSDNNLYGGKGTARDD